MEEQTQKELKIKCSAQVQLAYTIFEPETGTNPILNPLIFLHGITSCKETWKSIPQLLANATNRKAYSYDARNHGDSDWSGELTINDLVLDLRNFMESKDINKAILIGHSLGGTVSIKFALKAPEKVEMVVIEEMFVKKPPTHFYSIPLSYITMAPLAVEMIPVDADEDTASKIVMDFVFKNMPFNMRSSSENKKIDKSTMALKRRKDGRFQLKANMVAIEKGLRHFMEEESDELEHLIPYNGPACFVYGDKSHFQVGEDADNIRKYFPKAEFNEIKNARHTVHNDNPEAYFDTLLSFICRNGTFKDKL